MILIDKSASAAVMRAVWSLLDSALDIPIYDTVPEDADYPYIQIDAVTEKDFSTKTAYGSQVEIEVANYAAALETKTVQEVTGQVIEALKEADLLVEGFIVLGIELLRNECAASDVDNITYGVLSFSVWVQQLPAGGNNGQV